MDVLDYLKKHDISFVEHRHSAVFTVEEAKNDPIHTKIEGIHSKNLFLKNRKSTRFFLVVMPANKPFHISEFENIVNDKIKFGNEQNLKELLGVSAGAVSPFGLLNDTEHIVELFIDEEIWNAKIVSFHPNDNSKTLELQGKDFQTYVDSLKNPLRVLKV